jgi:ligand-binding SRPBCC domain-containing protein
VSKFYTASKHTLKVLNLFRMGQVFRYKSLTLVLSCFVFIFGMLPQKSFANVTLTAPSLTVYACGGAFPTAYSALNNIVITEGNNGDFANNQTNVTLILTAPANFEFLAGTGTTTAAAGNNLSIGSTVVTTTTITITFSVSGTNKQDILTISGIQVRGINTASGPGNILRTAVNPGTGTIAGITNGSTNFGTLTSVNQTVPSITTSTSQSSCSGSLTNIALTSSPAGASFTWILGTVTNVTGGSAGSGTTIAQTLNSTGSPGSVEYIVTPTLNGCVGTSVTITNTVNSLPQGILTANGPFCVTGTGQLTFTSTDGESPFTVIYNDGVANRTVSGVTSGTPYNVFTNPVTTTTTYTLVSVTDNNGCVRSSGFTGTSATITVNPLPQGSITANGPFCATGTGQITWTSTAGVGPFTVVYNDGVADRTASSVTSGTPFNVVTNPVTITTTYTLVSVTDSKGCVRSSGFTSASSTITVNSLPQGSLTANGPFCVTGTGQLTWTSTAGVGPFTVIYNDGVANRTVVGVTSGTAFNVFTNPVNSTTTYTLVSVTDSKGCVRSSGFTGGSITITVNPIPQGILTANSLCVTGVGQLTFTATVGVGPFTIIYNDGVANRTASGVTSGTPFNVFTNPVTTTTSYGLVSVTDNNGCVRSLGFTGTSATITVNPLPQGSLTANGPFCATGTGQITWTSTTGVGPFTVVYNDGVADRTANSVTSGTPFNVFTNPVTTTTTYTLVSVTDSKGCVRSSGFTGGSVTITVNPLPQGSLTANGPFCVTGTGQITWTSTAGVGPFTVIYNDGVANRTVVGVTSGTAFNVFINPVITTTTYSLVSVTDSKGCVRSSGFTSGSILITVNPIPQGILTANGPLCSTGTGQLTFTSTVGVGPFIIIYNDGVANRTVIGVTSGTPFNVFTNPVTTTTTYTLVSVTDNNGCVRSSGFTGSSALITVNPLPQGTITANGPFCTTGTGQITWTSTAGTGPFTVVYNDGVADRTANSVISGTAFNVFTNPVTTTTTYTLVSVTDNKGCVRSSGFTGSPITITVNPLPQGSLTANGPFCVTGTGQLTWTSTAGAGPFTVIYNDGVANRTANSVTSGTAFNAFTNPVTTTTTYTLVSVTDSKGCVRSSGFTGATITITVNPLPQGILTANGPFCVTGTGQLTWTSTAGAGPFTVIYNDGVANRTANSVTSGTAFNVFTNPVTTTTIYTLVSVTDNNGCVRSSGFTGGSITITVSPLPQGSITSNSPLCVTGTGQITWTSTAGVSPFTVVYNDGVADRSVGGVTSGTAFNVFTNPVTTTTTYTLVSVTDSKGCVRSSGFTGNTATITVNPLPTITPAASAATVCFSTSAQTTPLTYSATTNSPNTYSITWDAAGTTAGFLPVTNAALPASPISISVPPNAGAATYTGTLTVKNANGCLSNTSSFSLTVNPLPTISTAATATSVCLSPSAQTTLLTYSATTGTPTTYSITWDVVGTAAGFVAVTDAALPASQISISVPVTVASATYTGTVTVKNANGCISTGINFFLTVLPLPTITPAAGAAGVCLSTSAQTTPLTYTAGNSPIIYSITWNAAATTAGFAPITNASLPASPITISVPANAAVNSYTGTITVMNANGCNSSIGKDFTVTVNPLPTIIPAASAANVCFSNSVQTTPLTYTATNSPTTYSITWNGAATAAGFAAVTNAALPASPVIISVPANAPVNTYTGTITVKNANGCLSTTGMNFTVTINPLPQGSLTANGLFCATGTGTLTWTATTGVGPFTVVYNDGTANRTQINVTSGTAFNVFTDPVISTTTYTLVSVTDANGCVRSTGFTGGAAIIIVRNPPAITTQPSTQTICSTFPVSFSVVATGDGLTYQWFKGGTALTDNAFITGSATASITIDPVDVTDNGNYHVVVSGIFPCTTITSDDASLTVDKEINIDTEPLATQTVCEGNTVTFSVVATGTGLTYQWRKGNTSLVNGGNISGSTTATLTLSNISTADATTAATRYSVVVSDAGGACPTAFSSKAALIVNINSTISLLSGPATQTVCINTAIANVAYSVGGGATGASITAGTLPAGVSGSFSSGVFTISGTPTVFGTFSYTVTTSGPCINPSLAGTITVNDNSTINLSSAAGTNGQTICTTSPITNITYLLGGSSTGATIAGLPAGVTSSYNSGTQTFTITGTPSVTGVFNYTVSSTGPCVQTATGSITIAPPSIGGTLSPSDSYACAASNTGTITLTGQTGAILRWEFATDGGAVWTSIANTGTTLTYNNLTQSTVYRAVIQSGICANVYSTKAAVGMNPLIIPTVTANPNPICLGQSSVLTATIVYPAVNPFPLETFDLANPANWSGNNANNDNTQPNSEWGETSNNGKTFNGVYYQANTIPTNGHFMIVNGTVGKAGNTAILGTPVFSTVGMMTATLQWYQAYNMNAGTLGRVEISSDSGATYVPLAEYFGPSNFGNPNNGFIQLSIPLTAYLGKPNVKIQFYYTGTAGSNWAIDNVEVVGPMMPITYAWTPTTYLSPTTGPIVTSTPTIGGSFPYTVNVSGGSCHLGNATVTLVVNASPTITLGAFPSVCQGITSANLPYNIISGAPNKYSIVYDSTALAAGFINVTNAFLPASPVALVIPAAAGASTYNGVFTVNRDGGISCPNSSVAFTVTILPKPSIAPQVATICSGTAFTVTPANGGSNIIPAGTKYTWTAPAVTGGITGGSAQATPQSSISQSLTNPTNSVQTATYTITPIGPDCTGATFTVTITVNPLPVVTGTTSATRCDAGSVTLGAIASVGTLNWYSVASGGTSIGTGSPFTTPNIISTTTFYVEATNAGCTSARVPVVANVNTGVTISAQPQNMSLCPQPFVPLSTTFSVTAANATGYQWQVSTNAGSTWANVAAGATYNGVTTNTLTVTGITEAMEGRQYRNVISSVPFCFAVNSAPATLTIINVWKGLVSSTWSTPANWWGDVVPDINCQFVIVPNVSPLPFPVLTGSETDSVRTIVIRKDAFVTVTQLSTLQVRESIYADMNNISYGTLDGTDGRIELNGGNSHPYGDDGTQFIAGSFFYKRTLKDFKISNPLNATVSSTANDTLNITGHLSFGNVTNVTLFTGNNITLKSSASRTASVDEIQVNGAGTALNAITGKVIVERYIPPHRAWRLLTFPFNNSSQTINQAWQEGATNVTGAYPGGYNNPHPGFGTHITGIDSVNDWKMGYDAGPLNNFSLKVHDPLRLTTSINGYIGLNQKYPLAAPGRGTNNTTLNYLQGYLLFVRSDRSLNMNLLPFGTPAPTVLRAQGILNTGTQPQFNAVDGFNLVGNPFASTIDMRRIVKSGGVSDFFYLFDSRYGSIGAFQVLSYDATNSTYVPFPGGGSYAAPYATPGSANYIESGQAFFVYSNGAGTVTLKENAKDTSSKSMIFRTSRQDAQLRTNLYVVNTDKTLLDGTLNQFSINGNNSIDQQDAIKIQNIAAGTYMGLSRDGRNLIIERRQLINLDDTIFYNMTTLTKRNYQLEFIANNLNQDALTGYLEDSYLKIKTPVSLTGTTTVNFTVNTDTASSVPNRFRLVFQGSPKAITFTKLQATQQNNDIAVDWAVTNEVNIRSYDVETSGNGKQFVRSATVDAKENDNSDEHYQWLDVNAKPGVYYYRIRSTSETGVIQYGNVAKLIVTRGRSDIKVYPNPVVGGKINVQMINQPAGNYTFRLVNGLGQVMLSKQIVHQEGSSIETIRGSKNVADENYRLEVTKPDKSKVSMNVLLQ